MRGRRNGSLHQPPRDAAALHEPYRAVAHGEGRAGVQDDAHRHGQSRDPSDEVVARLYEDEVAEVDAERRARDPREPCPGPRGEFLHDEEDRKGHHEDVDAREVPDDFEVGVVAREVLLQQHVAE